jgi:DNA repair protein RecN (Recombination protein N)
MLFKLTIQNYALIDQLELSFGVGLNIITGETGAGKSVLIGALGLLLGDRADSSSLLDKTRKCVIEGGFKTNSKVREFLKANDLDEENELIIHREINKDGKSRSFINDTPVNLSQLRELGVLLVDVHSQHETLLLNQSGFQLSVVDAFAGHNKLLVEYLILFREYLAKKKLLKELQQEEVKLRADQDFLQFQFNELSEARLDGGEQKKLEDELSVLSHAEEIKGGIEAFSETVSGSDTNLLSGLTGATTIITGLVKYSTGLDEAAKRLKALQIELKDIEYEIQKVTDNIQSNPKRLEIINDRLNLIYKLQHKHKLENIEDLIQLRESINNKISSFSSLEDLIQSTVQELGTLFSKVKEVAEKLSLNRQKAIPLIETKIKKQLSELAMPEAVLKIERTTLNDEELNSSGKDSIKFLFSANKGVPYSDISKVASGGELSRLMLCLKASVAKLVELPTIVFDEIDTGVSGEVAFKIGKVMQDLSGTHQLISITHLPQIASRGEDHFFVYKEIIGKKTFTLVKKLSNDERVVEIARMLSSDKPSAIALENARELLST